MAAAEIEGCITLVPCNGTGDNINLRTLQVNITAWQALVGSRIQLNGTYGPNVWYVDSVILSNDPAFDPECLTAILAPSIGSITVVGIGECGEEITSTNCCALVTNCVTGLTLNVALGVVNSSEYADWETVIDHLIEIDDPNYPGIWHVDGLCCMNALVDPCANVSACALGGVSIAFDLVIDNGEDVCPPNIYKLTNCETTIVIYTETNLYSYLESVISIVEFPGCWTVELGDSLTFITVTLIEGYDDCECCLEPIPEKYTRVIPKPDRHFYQVTQGQCDIKANVRFGEGYYRLFKTLKYGIANACDNINLDKLWIRKNLSDLATINDPTACIITTPVVPVICPEPAGNPFVPPVPPATYTFTVGEPGVGTGTFGCTTCLDGNPPASGILCPAFNMILDYNILDTIDINAVYVFSNASGCVITLGSFISEGATEGFATYTMTESNIVNAGIEPADPCASCAG